MLREQQRQLKVRVFSYSAQVVDSRQRIPREPAENGAFSGAFPPVPSRNKPEPAGNIPGKWKQYFDWKITVPGTVLFPSFPVTGTTPESCSFQSEIHRNISVSDRKAMENSSIRVNTAGLPYGISFDFF